MSAETPLTVQAAIAAVMGDLPGIGKDSTSPQGYQYRGIEAVTKEAQPLFAKYGVVIVPRSRVTQIVPSPSMKESWQDVYLSVDWTIIGPDGSTLQATTIGIGRDNSDKGANKAQTQAFKYLLLDLLCIADAKDDADGQSYEHDRQLPPPPAQGWPTLDQQKDGWEMCKQQTEAIADPDAKAAVVAWVKAQKLTFGSFTFDKFNEWTAQIDAATPVEVPA